MIWLRRCVEGLRAAGVDRSDRRELLVAIFGDLRTGRIFWDTCRFDAEELKTIIDEAFDPFIKKHPRIH